MKWLIVFLMLSGVGLRPPTLFAEKSGSENGLHDTTVLLIRHAEKPENGAGLSPAGEKRAAAYVHYFTTFRVDDTAATPKALFATADSKKSERPRLTLEPLSHALGLPINSQYKNADYAQLAEALRAKHHGKTVLIAWHHGEMPELLTALGANPTQFLPNGKWPSDQFNWLIELRYDHDGKLIADKSIKIEEQLN